MSDWLRVPVDDETKEQIKVLKDKGYMVVHRDAIRTVGAAVSHDKDHLLRASIPMQQIIRQDLAHSVARFISESEDFPIRETARGLCSVEYRTTFQWIGTKVSPEDSEYPLFLSERMRNAR